MRRYTFTLNAEKASDETYLTWTTVRFNDDGSMDVLTNNDGNGQFYRPFGTYDKASMRVTFTDVTSEATRIVATVMRREGIDCGEASHYGVCYPKACALDCSETRLTAAPSLMVGRPPRDKNVNKEWEKHTEANGRPPCYRPTLDSLDAGMSQILAMRAQDKADKVEAKRLGMRIGAYRSMKALG